MTYILNTTDGVVLSEIPDGMFDTSTTSITLIGKNVTNFGEPLNENFIKLLENFASASPPENPIKGQLWYNVVSGRLHVYDGTTFRPSGSPIVSPTRPLDMLAGDIWINNETNQVWFYDGTDLILTGPVYTSQQGVSGFVIETILDTYNRSHVICKLYIANTLLGIFSKDAFIPKSEIIGYGPVAKEIVVGFNATSYADVKFNMVATVAEKLVLSDGLTTKTAEEFAIKTEENVFTSKITIQNNDGIVLGDTEQIFINIVNDNLKLEHQISGGNISMRVKSGAITQDAITIKGLSSRVGIFNDNPQATLDVNGSLVISGDLYVGGSTTTINSTNLAIEDINIELGKITNPSDITANGGGITLKGATDKTITYVNSTESWDMSENLKIADSKEYRIGTNSVLSTDTLGDTVVNSQLTSVGNLITLQMDNGLNITGNIIDSGTSNLILRTTGSIDIETKKIINVDYPVEFSDAANKDYVDVTVYKRDIAFSMDVTGIAADADIAAILDVLYPYYDKDTAPTGVVVTGTKLRLHATSIQVTNGAVTAPTLTKSYINVDKDNVVNSQSVLQDVVAQNMLPPSTSVTVTRQNKLFIMGGGQHPQVGKWGFESDL